MDQTDVVSHHQHQTLSFFHFHFEMKLVGGTYPPTVASPFAFDRGSNFGRVEASFLLCSLYFILKPFWTARFHWHGAGRVGADWN